MARRTSSRPPAPSGDACRDRRRRARSRARGRSRRGLRAGRRRGGARSARGRRHREEEDAGDARDAACAKRRPKPTASACWRSPSRNTAPDRAGGFLRVHSHDEADPPRVHRVVERTRDQDRKEVAQVRRPEGAARREVGRPRRGSSSRRRSRRSGSAAGRSRSGELRRNRRQEIQHADPRAEQEDRPDVEHGGDRDRAAARSGTGCDSAMTRRTNQTATPSGSGRLCFTSDRRTARAAPGARPGTTG